MLLTKSPAARTSLIYVTVGALTIIWTVVWYVYMYNNPPSTPGPRYFAGGLMATGLTMLLIGFGIGRLGHAARNADNPAVVAAVAPPVTVPATPEVVPTTEETPVVAVANPNTVVHV